MRSSPILLALFVGFADLARAQNDTFDIFGWLPKENFLNAEVVPDYVSLPEEVPTRRILPEDVIPDSVQVVQLSSNRFAVRWTYTDLGTEKLLAFWETHQGSKIRITVGHFESAPVEFPAVAVPRAFTNYAQWKDGRPRRLKDKFFGVSEDDARKIVAGLKG